MKYLFSILLVLCLAMPVMAEDNSIEDEVIEDNSDNSIEDNSVHYTIDLGDGQGAILVFGDNNSIYLPDVSETEITPNEITVSNGRINLVLTDTDLIVDGIITRYSKLVFILEGESWDLVWYEQ